MARMQNDSGWFAKEQKQRAQRFLSPGPAEHIEAAQNHISAANMVEPHDHESAADHLNKAAVHASAAGEHYATHSKKMDSKGARWCEGPSVQSEGGESRDERGRIRGEGHEARQQSEHEDEEGSGSR